MSFSYWFGVFELGIAGFCISWPGLLMKAAGVALVIAGALRLFASSERK